MGKILRRNRIFSLLSNALNIRSSQKNYLFFLENRWFVTFWKAVAKTEKLMFEKFKMADFMELLGKKWVGYTDDVISLHTTYRKSSLKRSLLL